MIRFLLALLALGLLAAPAGAQTWQKACSAGAAFATTNVPPGTHVCYDFTADTTSGPLFVGGCDNYDVFFHRDIDATDSANTVQIEVCGDVGNCGQSSWVLENATLDGLAAGTEAVYGASAIWILANPATYVAGTGRVIIKCNIR